jgi:hypothetical protein
MAVSVLLAGARDLGQLAQFPGFAVGELGQEALTHSRANRQHYGIEIGPRHSGRLGWRRVRRHGYREFPLGGFMNG